MIILGKSWGQKFALTARPKIRSPFLGKREKTGASKRVRKVVFEKRVKTS